MKSLISKQVERFLREQKNYKRWLAVFLCLAVVVTLGTTAALKYKGIAVTGDADAAQEMHMEQTGEAQTVASEEVPEGMRRHVHTDACYEERKVLVCEEGKAEAGDAADAGTDAGSAEGSGDTGTAGGHHHSDSCYEVTGGELVCGKEEHTHDDSCHTGGGETLTCGKEEGEGATDGHQHSDSCYGEDGELTCGKDEGEGAEEGHHHDDSCYGSSDGELTCSKEEHKHNESCYNGGEKKLICGLEEGAGAAEIQAAPAAETPAADAAPAAEAPAVEGEHIHTDACYELQKVLICGKEEGELEEIPMEEEFKAGKLTCKGEDYEIVVSYGAEAKIPEGAKLKVEEIEKDSETYEKCYNQMVEALAAESDGEEPEVSFIRFFDITILADGKEIEPEKEVTVQINYNDAVVDDDEEQEGFAVHFPSKGGTEILDAEVKEKKGFEFSQGSFSIAGGGLAKAPAKAGRLEWSGDGCKIIVSWDKKVTVPADAKLNVEEIKKSNESYRKYLNNSKGAIKAKKNGKSEENGTEESEFARFFKISVEDGSGEKISTNNDVKISVEYDNAITAGTVGTAAMVLAADDNSEVLGDLTDMEEGEEISKFQANRKLDGKDFNVGTMVLAEGEDGVIEGGGTGIEGTHDDISEYLKNIDTANNWQIVENGYGGNDATHKQESNDKKVRIQKNVIPTGVENEFYVYLSIDVKTTVSEQIDLSAFEVITHKFQNEEAGRIIETNNSQNVGFVLSTVKPNISEKNIASHIKLADWNGNVIPGLDDLYAGWGKEIDPDGANAQENITLVYRVGNKVYGIAAAGKSMEGKTIKLPDSLVKEIIKHHKETSILQEVTDVMGENITFVEDAFVDSKGNKCNFLGDYDPRKDDSGNDKTYYDAEQEKLIWTPMVNPGCETDPDAADIAEIKNGEFWNLNAAQLVYKVRLDVTAESFQSCAEHIGEDGKAENGEACVKCNLSSDNDPGHRNAVNEKATLTYDGGSIDFPVPTVRGLLYDVPLKKVDADDNTVALEGAEFELRKTNTEITDENGIPYGPIKGTTIEDGTFRFTDLPWGTYEIWEMKAPEGYKAVPEEDGKIVGKKVGEVTVCYTTKPNEVTRETITLEDGTSEIQPNMVASKAEEIIPTVDENGNITRETRRDLEKEKDGISFLIKNEKIPPIKLVKKWNDENDVRNLRPDDVTFVVKYLDKETGEYKLISQYKDKDGNITYTKDTDGTANGKVILTADASGNWEKVLYGLPESTDYMVTEVLPDDSAYKPVTSIKVEGIDGAEGTTERIYDIGKGVTGSAVGEADHPQNSEKEIKCYTITNELKKRNITLIKVDNDTLSSGTDDDPQTSTPLADAKFELWIRNAENYNARIARISPLEDNVLVSDEDGIITNAELKGELEYGEYWLVETKAPENYVRPENPYVLQIDENGVRLFYNDTQGDPIYGVPAPGTDGKYEIKVPNKTANKKVELWKIETGTSTVSGNELIDAEYLTGAKFDVYYTPSLEGSLNWPEDETAIRHWESIAGGSIVEITDGEQKPVDVLEIGRYLIKETEAPDGYNSISGDMTITVKADGIGSSSSSIEVKGPVEGKYKIYITNSAGLELPEAGGPGTAAYTFGGLAMIIAVSLMYGLNMRRKREKGGME